MLKEDSTSAHPKFERGDDRRFGRNGMPLTLTRVLNVGSVAWPFARALALSALALLVVSAGAPAMDRLRVRADSGEHSLAGKIIVEAKDGGLLIQLADGALEAVQPEQLVERTRDDVAFAPLTSDQLAKQLLSELPDGFDIHKTAHFVICHNTSREYAQWCGGLFERLYKGFTNYWSRRGIKLHDPEFPLAAVVCGDRDSYVRFSRRELGDSAGSIIGYYSLKTNRITMYDLTGMESIRGGGRRGSAAEINLLLAQPQAENLVATIVHEATHQLAFNTGLQTRFADIPGWLSEGLAVYFEKPDLQSAKGWKGIGGVNADRLEQFREYLPQRPSDSLKSLIVDDKRIRSPRVAAPAYAEAWALNYFLIQQRPKEFVAYLKVLQQKPPMVWDDPETRLREFRSAFGGDLNKLDADFLRLIQRLK